jgi:hypothetical protein
VPSRCRRHRTGRKRRRKPTTADDDDEVQAVDVNTLDRSQLDVDAYVLVHGIAPKPRAATLNAGDSMAWSSNDIAKRRLGRRGEAKAHPFWDARVGADMTVAREPTTMSELLADKANGGKEQQSYGAARAAVTAPGAGPIWDKTAVEARVDPSQNQSKLGTSISKQAPLTDQTSLTLSSGANVIQQGIVTGPGTVAQLRHRAVGKPHRHGHQPHRRREALDQRRWLRKIGAEQQLGGGGRGHGVRIDRRNAAGHDQQEHQRRL